MKKTRFLSLLLAAALTASSLPMVVTADATAESGNLLDGATYTAATGTTIGAAKLNNPDASTEWGNHFLSVADRPFGSAGKCFLLNFNLTEAQASEQLYITANLRNAQPAATKTDATGRFRLNGTATGDVRVNPGNRLGNWYETGELALPKAANKVGTNEVTYIRWQNANQTHDVDFDNIRIYYKDTNGNPVDIVPTITDNFFSKGFSKGEYTLFEDIEEEYTIADSDDYTNTQFTIKLKEAIEPGFYIFGGELRLGEFTCEGASGAYTDGVNNAEIIIKAGDEVVLDGELIDTVWTEYGWEMLVTKATDTLTFIVDGESSTVADAQKINYRNLSLKFDRGFEYAVEAEKENLLAGVDASLAEGIAAFEDVEGTGSLYIPERNLNGATGQDTAYISFMIPRALVGGTKYFVSFDICYHNGTTTSEPCVRPLIGCFINERNPGVVDAGGISDNYVPPVEGKNELTNRPDRNSKGQMFPQYYPKRDEMQHFEGFFTPAADQKSLTITFQRGQNATSHNNPLTVDNLKVWSENGVVYSTDFNVPADEVGVSYFEYDGMTINSKVIPELRDVKIEHTSVTPFDTAEADVVYDTSKLSVKKGIYTFTTNVAATAAGAKAKLIVNVAGQAPIETELVEIPVTDTEYAELTVSFEAEHGAKITSIVIDTDLAGATLKLSDTELTYSAGDDDAGIPNIGIIMVLLKKKSGSDAQPMPKLNKNLIKEGKFKEAPTVIKEGYDTSTAAWYANAKMDYFYDDKGIIDKEAPMVYHDQTITWDDDGYVVVSGRRANIGRVWYNPGLILQPGIYELSVDLKAVNINETVVRFTAGDMDDKALSPAKLAPLNTNWKTFTNKFTVTAPTQLRIAFFGGTGSGHKHDFAIDNLFLYMVDYYDPTKTDEGTTTDTPVEVKPVVDDASSVKPAVAGNLIPNGDLKVAPEVIKEGYDSTKAAWYANASMSHAYDKEGNLLKDDPKVYHDHNITWNNIGYVSVTGRIANIGRVWCNPGVTLEPGTYVLSVDLRTANEGEKSVVRFTVGNQDDKAFAPATSAGITNAWQTFTYQFTVDAAQSVRIAFFGGTGAGHKNDFCIDNLVLLKK